MAQTSASESPLHRRDGESVYDSFMLQVVAAILEREGKILICRRTPQQSHPLKWEFPGGKIEPGETPHAALTRELHEELGILDAAGEEILRYRFAYPGKSPILLIFLRVVSYTGEPRNLIFHEIRWEPARPPRLLRFPRRRPRFHPLSGDLIRHTGLYAETRLSALLLSA